LAIQTCDFALVDSASLELKLLLTSRLLVCNKQKFSWW